jgi:hypothetical protein
MNRLWSGIVKVLGLLNLVVLAYADPSTPNQIPMSPQMAQPHDGWVVVVPAIILMVLVPMIWVFGKKK